MTGIKKTKLILTMLILSSILTACGNSNRTRIDSSDVVYVEDLMDESRKQEGLASEIVKLTKKEDFIRQYDNDIYVEDYLDVKERLDKEFSKHLEEKFEKDLNRDFVVIADMEYYNPTLKQAKEENWTLEDILKEPTKHVRTLKFNTYLYTEENESTNKINKYMDKDYIEYKKNGYYKIHIKTYKIKESAKEEGLEVIIDNEDIRILQERTENGLSFVYGEDINRIIKKLKKKYNKEFEYKSDIPRTDYGKNQITLKEDSDVIFDTNIVGKFDNELDKFLTALAQRYMYDLVYEILKEEGIENYVLPITIPYDTDSYKTDTVSYDVSKIKTKEDILRFLRTGYLGEYDTTLVYLKEPQEEINYKALMNVSEKIMGLIGDKENGEPRHMMFIEYYEIDKVRMPRVKYLFEKDKTCSAVYREDASLGNVFKLSRMSREETEGFHYLDIFANKEEKFLNLIMIEPKNFKGLTVEEFIKRTYRESKY